MKKEIHLKRSDIIELVTGSRLKEKAVFITGLAGSGKSWIAEAVCEKLKERKQNIIRLQCRENWTAADFYQAMSEAVSLFTNDKSFLKICRDTRKLAEILDKYRIWIVIDDFHWVENTDTLSLIDDVKSCSDVKLFYFTRKRPEFSIAQATMVHHVFLKSLTDTEVYDMIDQAFSFHSIQNSDRIRKEVFRLSQGYPFAVKAICSLLQNGMITLPEIELFERGKFLEKCYENPVWDFIDVDCKELLKLFCLLRIPVRPDEIIEDFSRTTGEKVEKLKSLCMFEADMQGKVTVHAVIRSAILSRFSREEIIEFHHRVALLLKNRFILESSYLSEIVYHFIMAGRIDEAAGAVVEFSRANLFLQETSADMIPLIIFLMDKSESRKKDLKVALTGQLIQQDRFSEALELLSELDVFEQKYYCACIEYLTGNSAAALEKFNQLLENTENREQQFLLMIKISMCCLFMGDMEKAADILKRISMMDLLKNNRAAMIWYYSSKAKMHYYCAETDLSLKSIDSAITLARQANMKNGLGLFLLWKGYVLQILDRFEEASAMAGEALKIGEETNDSFKLGSAVSLMGQVCHMTGDYSREIEHRLRSIDFYSRAGSITSVAVNYAPIGTAYLKLGKIQTAEHYFLKALSVIDSIEDNLPKVYLNNAYCEYLIVTGKFQEAFDRLNAAKTFFQGNCPTLFTSYNLLMGTVLEKMGNLDEARKYYQQYRTDMDTMPLETRKHLQRDDDWFINRVRERQGVRVLRRGMETVIIEDELLDKIRKTAEKHEVFADFSETKLTVDGQEINVSRKRTLFRLLQVLMSSPGTEFSAEQLYPEIWGRTYEYYADSATFRSTISRLRVLLDQKNHVRFILNTTDSNRCCFNAAVNYCALMP